MAENLRDVRDALDAILRRLTLLERRKPPTSAIGVQDATGLSMDEVIGIKADTNVTFTREPGTGFLKISAAGGGGGGGASTADAFVTIGHPADLTAERALTAGTDLSLTDGGANGAATLAHGAGSSATNHVTNGNAHDHAGGDGGTVAHGSLGAVGADDHHAKSHAHDGADGSGTVAHSATTGKTANDHHNQSHGNADHTTTGTPGSSAPGDAAAQGSSASVARLDHAHGRESYATMASNLKQYVRFVFAPDAAPGDAVTAGDQQGNIYHSGPLGITATTLYVDAETAPGASGLPVTVQYGDTNDLDTVASWTTIATYTLSSEKSNKQTSMTNASVPADRLIRMNIGTIVGTPKDVTVTLEGKEALTT